MKSQLRCKLQEHSLRIEAVPDLQCAWLILMFCAAARANYFLRVVHPGSSEEFARQHDAAIWQVFLQLSNITDGHETRDLASLPCRHGGLGLRSAARGAQAAYWSSWADSLPMIRKRHPEVADAIMFAIVRRGGGAHIEAARHCWEHLQGVGFDAPEWGDLVRGVRPGYDPLVDDFTTIVHARLATLRFRGRRSQLLGRHHLAQTGRSTSGSDAITTRPHGWDPIHVHAALQRVPFSAAGVPCVAPQAPLATPPLVIVHLPMWPST